MEGLFDVVDDLFFVFVVLYSGGGSGLFIDIVDDCVCGKVVGDWWCDGSGCDLEVAVVGKDVVDKASCFVSGVVTGGCRDGCEEVVFVEEVEVGDGDVENVDVNVADDEDGGGRVSLLNGVDSGCEVGGKIGVVVRWSIEADDSVAWLGF